MKLFSHLSLEGFSNTYVIATDSSKSCVVIDPGSMDSDLLKIFLKNEIDPELVLITRAETHHMAGLDTLRKIYQPEIYGIESFDLSFGPKQTPVENGTADELVEYRDISFNGFSISAISFPGAWIDGSMYIVDGVLFPGAMFSAGGLREVDAGYPHALLVESLKSVFSTLPSPTWVFPAYGPPTTIQVELRSNPALRRPVEHHALEDSV